MLGSMENAKRVWVLNVYYYHKFPNNQETTACFKPSAAAPAAAAANDFRISDKSPQKNCFSQ